MAQRRGVLWIKTAKHRAISPIFLQKERTAFFKNSVCS